MGVSNTKCKDNAGASASFTSCSSTSSDTSFSYAVNCCVNCCMCKRAAPKDDSEEVEAMIKKKQQEQVVQSPPRSRSYGTTKKHQEVSVKVERDDQRDTHDTYDKNQKFDKHGKFSRDDKFERNKKFDRSEVLDRSEIINRSVRLERSAKFDQPIKRDNKNNDRANKSSFAPVDDNLDPSSKKKAILKSLVKKDNNIRSKSDGVFNKPEETSEGCTFTGRGGMKRYSSALYIVFNRNRQKQVDSIGLSREAGALLDHAYLNQARDQLFHIDRWNFNIFTLENNTCGHSLHFILVKLFDEYHFIKRFKLDVINFFRFIKLVEEGYHKSNPYHNAIHAADVVQAMHCNIQPPQIRKNLSSEECMAAIVAAACHDLDHPGINQSYLIKTNNILAKLYNNSSVLENHHYKATKQLLHQTSLFTHLSKRQYKTIDEIMLATILATDIYHHKDFLNKFQEGIKQKTFNLRKSFDDRTFILQMSLKCADICNPCRLWPVCYRWSEMICNEFFTQGDCEKNLNIEVSPNFDRNTSSIASVQIGFTSFIVEPLFLMWDEYVPSVRSKEMLMNLKRNKENWHKIKKLNLQIDLKNLYLMNRNSLNSNELWENRSNNNNNHNNADEQKCDPCDDNNNNNNNENTNNNNDNNNENNNSNNNNNDEDDNNNNKNNDNNNDNNNNNNNNNKNDDNNKNNDNNNQNNSNNNNNKKNDNNNKNNDSNDDNNQKNNDTSNDNNENNNNNNKSNNNDDNKEKNNDNNNKNNKNYNNNNENNNNNNSNNNNNKNDDDDEEVSDFYKKQICISLEDEEFSTPEVAVWSCERRSSAPVHNYVPHKSIRYKRVYEIGSFRGGPTTHPFKGQPVKTIVHNLKSRVNVYFKTYVHAGKYKEEKKAYLEKTSSNGKSLNKISFSENVSNERSAQTLEMYRTSCRRSSFPLNVALRSVSRITPQ